MEYVRCRYFVRGSGRIFQRSGGLQSQVSMVSGVRRDHNRHHRQEHPASPMTVQRWTASVVAGWIPGGLRRERGWHRFAHTVRCCTRLIAMGPHEYRHGNRTRRVRGAARAAIPGSVFGHVPWRGVGRLRSALCPVRFSGRLLSWERLWSGCDEFVGRGGLGGVAVFWTVVV